MSKAAELAALIGSQSALSNRNLIINGAMQVAQRGTSETGVTSGGSYRNAPDRFRFGLSSAGTWTVSQDSDAPTGFANSYKLACTTADASLSAGDYIDFLTGFEGQDVQQLKKGTASAESVTLSFWCKSNKTGTYIVNLQDTDNARTIAKSYTVNAADTWEYKTLAFVGDTSGALDNDNAQSFRVKWWFAAGSTYSSGTLATSWEANTAANYAVGQVNLADSTSNYFNITGIQLEVGEQATPFEHRSYGDELARCQRYYYEYSTSNGSNFLGVGNVYQTDQLICPVYSPTVMRVNPTLSKTLDGSSEWLTTYDGFTGTNSNANTSLNNTGTQKIGTNYIYITSAGRTGNAGECHWLVIKSGAALHFDAEL